MQLSSGRYVKSLYGILAMVLYIASVSALTLPLRVEYLSSDYGLRDNRVQDIDIYGIIIFQLNI